MMAVNFDSLRSTTALTPPRILLHGVAGIGKTTFAAGADEPVFLCTEDGLGTTPDGHAESSPGQESSADRH